MGTLVAAADMPNTAAEDIVAAAAGGFSSAAASGALAATAAVGRAPIAAAAAEPAPAKLTQAAVLPLPPPAATAAGMMINSLAVTEAAATQAGTEGMAPPANHASTAVYGHGGSGRPAADQGSGEQLVTGATTSQAPSLPACAVGRGAASATVGGGANPSAEVALCASAAGSPIAALAAGAVGQAAGGSGAASAGQYQLKETVRVQEAAMEVLQLCTQLQVRKHLVLKGVFLDAFCHSNAMGLSMCTGIGSD